MVQLATELLREQIRPVRIVSISDEGGEPRGEFVSNQQRFVFKFTKSGMVTYRPNGTGKGAGQSDRGDSRTTAIQARLDRVKAMLRAA